MKRRRRRRRSARVAVAIVLGLVVAIAGLLGLSARHRAFYARLIGGWPSVAPSIATPPSSSPPAARPGAARPRQPAASLDTPRGAPRPATQGTPSAARSAEARQPQVAVRVAPRERSASRSSPALTAPASPPGAAALEPTSVPRGGVGDEVIVRIIDELPPQLPFVGAPPEWELKEFSGRAQLEVVRDEGRPVLRLGSERTSFALYRDVIVDIKEFPWLGWQWKVTKLPAGGDIRTRATDDQAAQVYVIFPRWPFPRISSDVLGYIWDTEAPVGLRVTSSQATNVKLVVLQSGSERLGQWVREERNVHRDYVELFGRDPPNVGKVAIMIDANDTVSEAEAFLDRLVFRRVATPRGTGRGTSLLKD